LLLVVLVTPVGTGAVAAQSLAEIARREAERRGSVAEPAKIYTNDDLRAYPTTIEVAGESSDASASAPDEADEADAVGQPTGSSDDESPSSTSAGDEEPERDESYWRSRIGTVRAQLQRNELFRQALESRINALTMEFVNLDDPAQRALVAIDRQKAQTEMERVEVEVGRLNDEIAEIEEEARRASVPPGWLR
jgi:chromosome segregation ATPase